MYLQISGSFRLSSEIKELFIIITVTLYYVSKLLAYLIPTPANLSIYIEPGYDDLEARGSNSLCTTNHLESMG